ncbi:hypothetical protein BC830DRAFT_1068977 [Chytriomyces sp. MP71]|nr:hypothetical protein BC830DRAFT_1068977 [Chytriomyces sp. MP71]
MLPKLHPIDKLEVLEPLSIVSSVQKQSSIFATTRAQHQSLRCDSCNKVFAYPSLLAEHVRSHTNERIFKCSYPG